MYAKDFDIQKVGIFREWVATARHIALVSHTNADGDACGSLLGMTLQIDKAARQALSVTPMLPNGCPHTFRWMPNSERILSGEKMLAECKKVLAEADLIVCVDLNAASRTDFLADSLVQSKAKKVLVDHHLNPAIEQFDLIFSDSDISSACELSVWLSQALWERRYFDADVARCFYTGLNTDTGGFAYSCESPSCFDAASLLVSYNIQAADIHNRIVNTFSINRMRFYGFAISQRLKIYPEQKTAIFAFSCEDQKAYNIGGEDMEGLVNYTLMMKEIEVGALLREEKDRTKVSLRSKYDVNVNLIAQQLGGGGHEKASGATVNMALPEAQQLVEQILHVADVKPLKFDQQ